MFKKILKIIFYIGLSLVILYLGAEAGYQIRYKVEQRKSFKAAESFNQAIVDMFLEDTYGGKTPGETFNLLVDALKKEDVNLAIKYFVLDPERRERYWNRFNELKEKGELDEYVEDLPEWEEFEQVRDEYNDWKSRAMVIHSETLKVAATVYDPYLKREDIVPPGKYIQQEIIFTINPNGIWKISLL